MKMWISGSAVSRKYIDMYEKIYNGNLAFDKMKYLIEKIPFVVPENFKLSEEWEFTLK